MAFKLTKEEIAKRDEHVENLEKAWGEIQEAVEEFNTRLAELREPVEEAVTKYNETLGEAKMFAEQIANQLEEEYDEKSEGWQEGEQGQAAEELKDAWRLNLEQLEVEWPKELEADDPDHAPELGELPTEAE